MKLIYAAVFAFFPLALRRRHSTLHCCRRSPVGSISPRIGTSPAEPAILTLPDDNCLDNETAGERDAIASQITAPEPQLEKVAEHDEDNIDITGPAANRIPGVAAATSAVQDDDATSQ